MSRHVPAHPAGNDDSSASGERLTRILLDIVGRIPSTDETHARTPRERARAIAAAAANKAALAAGTLALPPGPLGWLTLLPELATIWRIQRQMVADIAGAYGVSAELTRSHMLYCLFRHAAAQVLRDVTAQVGARLLIQEVPLRTLEKIAARIGLQLSKRMAGRGIARWLPVVGALGVAGYAYYDTAQVANTAIALFSGEPAASPRRAGRLRRTDPASS